MEGPRLDQVCIRRIPVPEEPSAAEESSEKSSEKSEAQSMEQ